MEPIVWATDRQGRQESVRAPVNKKFAPHPRKGGPAKSLHKIWKTDFHFAEWLGLGLKRLIHTIVNHDTTENDQTYATQSGPGPPSGSPGPGNLYRLHPPPFHFSSNCWQDR